MFEESMFVKCCGRMIVIWIEVREEGMGGSDFLGVYIVVVMGFVFYVVEVIREF